jgi:hypothetical protein
LNGLAAGATGADSVPCTAEAAWQRTCRNCVALASEATSADRLKIGTNWLIRSQGSREYTTCKPECDSQKWDNRLADETSA